MYNTKLSKQFVMSVMSYVIPTGHLQL